MRQLIILTIVIFTMACGKTVSCIDPDAVDFGVFCGQIFEPVCGCDNVTYPNPCEAKANGVRSYIGGPC